MLIGTAGSVFESFLPIFLIQFGSMGLINENWFSLFSLYTHSFPTSVTRLGYFLKFMAVDFHAKVAQMISDFLGYLENGKIFCVYFWDNNWRNWASLNCNIWSHCFQRTYLPIVSTSTQFFTCLHIITLSYSSHSHIRHSMELFSRRI